MRINKPIPLCPTVCCCPEIILEGKQFIIKDDYEGIIKIDLKDIDSLVKKINELLGLPGSSLDN